MNNDILLNLPFSGLELVSSDSEDVSNSRPGT